MLAIKAFKLKRSMIDTIVRKVGETEFQFEPKSLINIISTGTVMQLESITDTAVTLRDIHHTKERLLMRIDELVIEELADIVVHMGLAAE